MAGSPANHGRMTTKTNPTAPVTEPLPIAGTPFGDDDPRTTFAKAVALAGAVVTNVRPDQLDDPTPCTEFTVRDLLGHLDVVLRRVAAVGRGDNPMGIAEASAPLAGEAFLGTWRADAHAVQDAWTDAAALTRPVHFPWTDTDGAGALLMYTGELTVHTWDLATATGQRPAWDDAVVGRALARQRELLPDPNRSAQYAQVRDQLPEGVAWTGDPFADAVPVDAAAPLIDQLVAWSGRRP
jgi:uncharacterized protein (TIGR03086 family)